MVAGAGETPKDALENLAAEAKAGARQLAAPFAGPGRPEPDASWRFEVVDVRLIMGNPSTPRTWAAYGTLCSQGADPWEAQHRPRA